MWVIFQWKMPPPSIGGGDQNRLSGGAQSPTEIYSRQMSFGYPVPETGAGFSGAFTEITENRVK